MELAELVPLDELQGTDKASIMRLAISYMSCRHFFDAYFDGGHFFFFFCTSHNLRFIAISPNHTCTFHFSHFRAATRAGRRTVDQH